MCDMYYDRAGRPLKSYQDADWSIEGQRVARTELFGGVMVSTVHLVLDHQYGDGPPLIFETMVFGGPLDQMQERYSTEEQALQGHVKMVLRAQERP